MIGPLPKPVRDYLASFNLGCIAVTSTGEIQVIGAKELVRTDTVAALWWAKSLRSAHQTVQAIGEQRPDSVEAAVAELRAAANRVGVVLTEHGTVVVRAQVAVNQLQEKISDAQRAGSLKFFNSEYRRRREEAKAAGRGFMPYNLAMARLRSLLAGAAAGASIDGLIARVFERQ
jgi:hypothetical protein